jgi:hypothetical protein
MLTCGSTEWMTASRAEHVVSSDKQLATSVAFEAIDTCIVWLARAFKVILGSYTYRGSNHLSQAAWLTSEWAISVLCLCVRRLSQGSKL